MKYLGIVIFTLLLTIAGMTSCIKPESYPVEPVLEWVGWSDSTLLQGSFNQDSITLTFNFTDGDGDIGDDTQINVFLKDIRDGFVAQKFSIPKVPLEEAKRGISGTVNLVIYSTCCYFADGKQPCTKTEDQTNELVYEITMQDRAGNTSQPILTAPLQLICN